MKEPDRTRKNHGPRATLCYEQLVIANEARRVALDVTPLVGVRTGIGTAVAEILKSLQELQTAPVLLPYALSRSARSHSDTLPTGTHFSPWPARVLLTAWAHLDFPRIDGSLGEPHVIHATNYLVPPSKYPTLVSVYDCSFLRYPELCTPEVRALAPVLRRAISRGAFVHTASEFVAAEIEELLGPGLRNSERLAVVPLGIPPLGPPVDHSASVRELLGGHPYVLALGMMEPRKNLPHLVSAFGTLAAERSDVHLVLAGPDGPARPDVDSAIARLDATIRPRVVLCGPVSDIDRQALLHNARVLAYPSIYEGFGFPLLEAMTAGVPIVAARAGSIPEVAGDAALLVEPTDEIALASSIERLLEEDDTRTQLIARGHARVFDFSWEKTATGLSDLYHRLAP